MQNGQVVAVSCWPDRDSLRAWRHDPGHRRAKSLGINYWYSNYVVIITGFGVSP